MVAKGTKDIASAAQTKDVPQEQSRTGKRSSKKTSVTEARAHAQRMKLDAQKAQVLSVEAEEVPNPPKKEETQQSLRAKRRAGTTLERAIDDYLQDHEGGNHSEKTLEWHRTALGLLRTYLEEQREITLVGEVDSSDISSWFSFMRKTPGGHGKTTRNPCRADSPE